MIFVSIIALKGSERLYQRFLECISFRAKLEFHLGLMNQGESIISAPSDYFGKETKAPDYFRTETIVPIRHIDPFKEYNSTAEWQDDLKRKGYQKWASIMFYGTIGLSIYLLQIIIIKLVLNF
jgi:hypothetical protein